MIVPANTVFVERLQERCESLGLYIYTGLMWARIRGVKDEGCTLKGGLETREYVDFLALVIASE